MNPIEFKQAENKIRVLYIEDNLNDYILMQRLFTKLMEEKKRVYFTLEQVDRISKGLERLAQADIDIILTDLNLPDAKELEAITELISHFPTIPIIALTSAYAQEMGATAVKMGAQDYLLKDELSTTMIKHSIHYAIERKRLEKLKDEFISTVSHELKTPLSNIQGGAEILKTVGEINPEQEKILELILRNTDRLMRMINDILDLSRLESEHLQFNPSAVNLKALIRETIADFLKTTDENSILFEEKIPNLPNAYCDPNLIIQVFHNLLSNALRYAETKITITAQVIDDMICIEIMDDGPGIPLEDQQKLFTKFARIKQPEKRQGHTGTGLGLAICKEIIKLHDGKIWVKRATSRGAAFCFTLPFVKN